MPRLVTIAPAFPFAMPGDAPFTISTALRAGAMLPRPVIARPDAPPASLPRRISERMPRSTLPSLRQRTGFRLCEAGRDARTGETLFTVAE
jgi:hypothetical protein